MIDMAVVLPRNAERDAMLKDLSRPQKQRRMQSHYLYPDEPFSVRKKEFWRLDQAENLMNTFIPQKVLHEADGLILQPWAGDRSHYIPNTCDEVLKWKFAHLNSVDFRFRLIRGGKVPRVILLFI